MVPLRWTTLGLVVYMKDVMDVMGEMACQAFQEEMDFLGLGEKGDKLDHQDQLDHKGCLEV